MKQQLLVSNSFPPIANAESIVTAKMVWGLEYWGWGTVVCTVKPESNLGINDYDLMELLPKGVQIYRIKSLPGSKFNRLLRIMKLNKLSSLLSSLPDSEIFWFPKAFTAVKRVLLEKPCQVIQTRSFPITDHLLGLFIKKKFGIPWIAHFSDPWTDGPFYKPILPSLKRLHRFWEYKIIQAADKITFTAEKACELVMRKYPNQWIKKCCVIPHGYKVYPLVASRENTIDPSTLNIVYLGSFYGKRTPYSVFKALKILSTKFGVNNDICIWLIGRMPHKLYNNIISQYKIGQFVRIMDAVPYNQAMRYAQQADVLLTIETDYEHPDIFLSSKFIEYLGFQKPILGISHPSSNSIHFLTSMGCPVADLTSPEHIAETLNEIAKKWKLGKLKNLNAKKKKITKYNIINTTGQLASILDEISQKAS